MGIAPTKQELIIRRKQLIDADVSIAQKVFPLLTPEEAVRAWVCEQNLYEFVKDAWKHCESEQFVPGEHLKDICRHLEAFSDGWIKNLCYNIPPRHTKSTLFSVCFPAWEWSRYGPKYSDTVGARETYLSFSYREDLALRDNWRARRLMQSEWYQKRWGSRWSFSSDQNVKSRYTNNKGGARVAAAMCAAVGEGGSRIILDDPQSYDDAQRKTGCDAVWDFYTGTLSMRGFGLRTSKACIMQRLAVDDLTGRLRQMTEQGLEDWVFVSLPIVFDPKTVTKTYKGRDERGNWKISNTQHDVTWVPFGGDWRTEEGQPIWPELYGGEERAKEELEKIKRRTPELVWAAQGMQNPIPAGGLVFKSESWFPRYTHLPGMQGASKYDQPIVFTTWDMAVKDKETNDHSAGFIVAYYPTLDEYFVLDRIYGKWEFISQEAQIMSTAEKLIKENAVHVIESGGNGSALVASCNRLLEKALKRMGREQRPEIPTNRFYEWSPRGKSKVFRANLVSPKFRNQKVWWPRHAEATWLPHTIAEFLKFPMMKEDDQVDAIDQGIIWMETEGLELLRPEADYGAIRLGRPDYAGGLDEARNPNWSKW